jgi:hypothetical protein
MLNMHADFVFVLFSNGTEYPVYRQESNVCTFNNLEEPLQGHLSLTGKPSEMRLGWATGYNTTQAQWVKWGTEPTTYTWNVASTDYTYTSDEMCGDPATKKGWRAPGLLHTATMDNLTASARYYYIYGSDETGWSQEFSFRAVPVGGPSSEVTLVAYGDMGKAEEDHSLEHWPYESPSLNTTKNVIQQIDDLDLVMHIGDISYAVGYSSEWDTFMNQVLPIATAVPYMTSPGNHERDFPGSGSFYNGTDSGGECGIPYENRFIMPPPSSDHIYRKLENAQKKPFNKKITVQPVDKMINDTPWYSFDFGNIHFLMMSTEHNFSIDSQQYNWIVNDLSNVDKTVTPWVIFTGHRPMYIDSNYNDTKHTADQPVATALRANLEPVLLKYGVNLALWGHNHSYQRTCPVYQQQCGSNFPVHVVIGMAGFRVSTDTEKTPPAWLEVLDDAEYGYTRIHTTMYSLHFQYFSNTSGLKDDFTITQNA